MTERREFLELAHEFEPAKHSIGGWLVSIKLDGHRAFWDGGLTRGMDTELVPWANTSKDARYIERPKATGLWSRGGKTIQAPQWFLDALPDVPLDGELFAGRKRFQTVTSVCKQLYPVDADWKQIQYLVFDSPSYYNFAKIGKINTPNWTKVIGKEAWDFIKVRRPDTLPAAWSYDIAMSGVPASVTPDIWRVHQQDKLPQSRKEAIEVIDARLSECEALGDEGLILRHPNMPWEPKRTNNLLKVKKRWDAEATVLGYTWGRKTDRGSKLLGLMGNIIVETHQSDKIRGGIRFELSGFKDSERMLKLIGEGNQEEGLKFPGEQATASWTNPMFPIGSVLTFKYRELTEDGIPKEAQYDRKAD